TARGAGEHEGGCWFFFFKQKTAYELGLGIPAEPLPICRQNVGYSNFSQPQSHLSFCVLLQAGLRRDAVQPDIEAERKKRDEIEAGKSYCSRRSEERRVGKECRCRRAVNH